MREIKLKFMFIVLEYIFNKSSDNSLKKLAMELQADVSDKLNEV